MPSLVNIVRPRSTATCRLREHRICSSWPTRRPPWVIAGPSRKCTGESFTAIPTAPVALFRDPHGPAKVQWATHALAERDVPLAASPDEEDPPALPEDLKESSAFSGNRLFSPDSDADAWRKSGSPHIGASARWWSREEAGTLGGAPPLEAASSPSTRSNSTKRLPDEVAGGGPPNRRDRTDNQMEADLYQECLAFRDRFRQLFPPLFGWEEPMCREQGEPRSCVRKSIGGGGSRTLFYFPRAPHSLTSEPLPSRLLQGSFPPT